MLIFAMVRAAVLSVLIMYGMSPSQSAFGAGNAFPEDRLRLTDTRDFSQIRFMESYESKHSDFSFTAKLAAKLGVSRPPLRIDSQAKYGAHSIKIAFL